jgi:hypothetical protein
MGIVWPAAAAVIVLTLTSAAGATRSAAAAAPVNASPPVLSGTAREDQTLTSSSGSWGGTTPISYVYAWLRCDASGANCTTLSGTTGGTYKLTASDVGKTVRSRVTATNADGSAQALSAASGVIAKKGSAPAPTSQPTPTGAPVEGQTLNAPNGTWSGPAPTSYAYQWQRCTGSSCVDIAGAQSKNFTLTHDDVGKKLRYKLVATNSSGSGSTYSNLTAQIVAKGTPPVNVSLPIIVGTAAVGHQITVSTGQWTGAKTDGFTYQWQRCASGGTACAAISGAVSSSYTVATTDASQQLRTVVTASNAAGKTSATSAPVAVSASGGGSTGSSVPVTSLVAHPDHLLISDVKYNPSTFGKPGGSFTMRVKVVLEGTSKTVSGALVKVTGIPYNWVVQPPETPTAGDGWATIQITTTKKLPHSGALVMQVRARGPGNSDEALLGGFSTRRLVQISLH